VEVYGFLFRSEIFLRTTRELEYLFFCRGRRAGVHTGFRTITLVLYIGSLPNVATWFPCGRERTLFILGSLDQRSRSPLLYKYNFWQQDRFRTITLVLYIGSLTNLATRFPCGRGRTLFILGSLGQRSRSPLLYKYNFDNRVVSAR
jgi:hypothetical protein